MVSCREEGGGPETEVFGENGIGQLQYSLEGRMSAFLMRDTWPETDINEEWRVGQFVCYAATWELKGEFVHHYVDMSSVPAWVGRVFIRHANLDGDLLTLSVDPETSGSGETKPYTLVWRKMSSADEIWQGDPSKRKQLDRSNIKLGAFGLDTDTS
ncbi:MAG: lipocalin-like domain-containing protein [Pseudomonadota bacterium]